MQYIFSHIQRKIDLYPQPSCLGASISDAVSAIVPIAAVKQYPLGVLTLGEANIHKRGANNLLAIPATNTHIFVRILTSFPSLNVLKLFWL